MKTLRVSVVQAAPVAFALEPTIERVARFAGQAAAAGARLVVFPEAFVGGYPKGIDFGARVGQRSPEGRDWFRRYHQAAIDVPGPGADQLAAIAREHGVHLVIGVIERDGGTLYCTALTLAPEGTLLARHRKVMPTAMERLIWGSGDGSTLTVAATSIGRVGAVICWENFLPLLRAAMYAKGVELYCVPTVDDRETWLSTMRHVAMEGRCFVLSANQFARRRDYPSDYAPVQGDDPETVLIGGGSCIVSPMGVVLAGPARDGEAILTADLDLDDIPRGKFDLDVVGHCARPDLFRLELDETPRRVMVTGERKNG